MVSRPRCSLSESDEEEWHLTGECRLDPASCIYNTHLRGPKKKFVKVERSYNCRKRLIVDSDSKDKTVIPSSQSDLFEIDENLLKPIEYKDDLDISITLFTLESQKYYDEKKVATISLKAVFEIWREQDPTFSYTMLCSDMEQLHRETKYSVKTLDEKLIWIIRVGFYT
jgi:hypothetical protein